MVNDALSGSASVVSSNIRLSEAIIVGAGAVVVNHFDEGCIVIAGVPAKRKGPVLSHKGVPERSAENWRNYQSRSDRSRL